MNRRRLILAAFLGVAIAAGIGTIVLQHIVPWCAQTINAADISPNGGNSYSVASRLQPRWPLLFEVQTDAGGISNAIITEDGKPLVEPHALHKAILEQGNGRYSHWGPARQSVFIFSTSDNSDPRTNGRRYEIMARPGPSMFGASLMVALPIIALLLQRFWFPRSRTIDGMAAIALIVYGSFFFGRVTVATDTTLYFHWSELVPLGYPLFLSGIHTVFGLAWTGTIQITLLISACAFVAFSAERLTARWIVGVVVFLTLTCQTQIFLMEGSLISEALFIPLIILNLGAALLLVSEKSVVAALLLATSAALIMFVRPAGYFVPAGIIFLMVAQRGRFWWTTRWAFLPFVILMGATFIINHGVRDSSSQSMVGRVLFHHVVFLFNPRFASDENKEFANIVEKIMVNRLTIYTNMPDRTSRVTYSMNDYNHRMHAIVAGFDEHCSRISGSPCSNQLKETIWLQFFFSTIRHRPIQYLQLIGDGLLEAWRETIMFGWQTFSYYYSIEADDHAQRAEYSRRQALPLTAGNVDLHPELIGAFPGAVVDALDVARAFIASQRWLVYLIGIVTLLAIPISVFSRSRHWLALGYCGAIIHGSMLLTTAVTVFIPRYSLPVDPVIILAGIIALDRIISLSIRMMRPRIAPPQPAQ